MPADEVIHSFDRKTALNWVKLMVADVGAAFDPDKPIEDYRKPRSGKPVFDPQQFDAMENDRLDAIHVLGPDIYTFAQFEIRAHRRRGTRGVRQHTRSVPRDLMGRRVKLDERGQWVLAADPGQAV
jgi:hypothetical protein